MINRPKKTTTPAIAGLIIITISALAISCADLFLNNGDNVPFEDFREAELISFGRDSTIVFENDSTWTAFWNEYCYNWDRYGNRFPAPHVDFEHITVVAVFFNTVNNGCRDWAPVIKKVARKNDEIIVYVSPLPDLGRCTALCDPLHVIKIPRYDLPIRFANYPL